MRAILDAVRELGQAAQRESHHELAELARNLRQALEDHLADLGHPAPDAAAQLDSTLALSHDDWRALAHLP